MSRILRSVSHALKGLVFAFRHEKNFQIESAVGALAIVGMVVLPLTGLERALIVFALALVLALELANTAFEKVMDILKPRVHPYARVIKDMMAGAVLLAFVAALALCGTIFFSALQLLYGT